MECHGNLLTIIVICYTFFVMADRDYLGVFGINDGTDMVNVRENSIIYIKQRFGQTTVSCVCFV